MLVEVDLSALQKTNWHEYVARFALGGLITAAAGFIAKQFGPAIGGLFLAFPAIFPATATLVEKHEMERKRRHNLSGVQRGVLVAGVASAGTAMGSLALFAFAGTFWKLIPYLDVWLVLMLALAAWAVVAPMVWLARRRL